MVANGMIELSSITWAKAIAWQVASSGSESDSFAGGAGFFLRHPQQHRKEPQSTRTTTPAQVEGSTPTGTTQLEAIMPDSPGAVQRRAAVRRQWAEASAGRPMLLVGGSGLLAATFFSFFSYVVNISNAELIAGL